MNTSARVRTRGFTLVELLVTIAIIAVLAAILFSITRMAILKAQEAPCMSNLKQIGTALNSYAVDHNMRLPGPLYVGQSPLYDGWRKNLTTHLVEYLEEAPEPGKTNFYVQAFGCPAWWKGVDKNNKDKPVAYRLGGDVKLNDGRVVFPWTYQADGGAMPEDKPARITDIDPISATRTWALIEMDQAYGGTWTNMGPKGPVHGNKRMALFFDWQVRGVPAGQIKK